MQTNLGGATNPNSAATSASKNPERQSINRSVDHKFVLMQRCRIIKGSKFSQRSNACRCNQLKEPSLLDSHARVRRLRCDILSVPTRWRRPIFGAAPELAESARSLPEHSDLALRTQRAASITFRVGARKGPSPPNSHQVTDGTLVATWSEAIAHRVVGASQVIARIVMARVGRSCI